ncbi:transcription termination factor 1 [Mixophyes fleayi]|uniref:transcription termination factor 1 n=1 Tax=Mixophyes fleayi TaxID=3061075 RepID=UPI003F4DF902
MYVEKKVRNKTKERERHLGETSDWDESSHRDSQIVTGSGIKKKKRKTDNGSLGRDADFHGSPKKKMCTLHDFVLEDTETQDAECFSPFSGDTLLDEHTDLEDHHRASSKKKKKKRKPSQEVDESLQEDVSASVGLEEETIKKSRSRKSRTAEDLTSFVGDGSLDNVGVSEDFSFSDRRHLEGNLRRKKKKHKTDRDRSQTEDSLTEDLLTFSDRNTGKHKDGNLQTIEPNSESDDNARKPEKKKKKKTLYTLREDGSHNLFKGSELETDDGTKTQVKKKKSPKKKKRNRDPEDDPDETPDLEQSFSSGFGTITTTKKTRTKSHCDDSTDIDQTLIEPSACEDEHHENENVDNNEAGLSTVNTNGSSSDKPKGRKSNLCIRDRDVALLEEFVPKIRSLSKSTVQTLVTDELERIRDAKQRGDMLLDEHTDLEDHHPASRKKKKKRKPSQEVDESLQDDVLTSVGLGEETIKKSRSRKSRTAEDLTSFVGDGSLDNVGVSEDFSCSDRRHLEGNLRRKKKKQKTDRDRSQTEDSLTEDLLTFSDRNTGNHKDGNSQTNEPNSESDDNARKPDKKKKKTLYTLREDGSTNLFKGSELETDDDGTKTQVKKKKSPKKNKRNRDPEDDPEETPELEQSFSSGFGTITTTKETRTKSHCDDSTDIDQTLTEPSACEAERHENETVDNNEAGLSTENTDGGSSPKPKPERRFSTRIRDRDVALLEEFFPKIRSLSKSTVQTLIKDDLERIRDAKQNGIKFETGRFSAAEDDQIRKNVKEFLALTGLEKGEMLFHSYRFPDKKSTIEQVKRKFQFRSRIGEGVYHTLQEIYSRGAKLFDSSGTKGRFSEEEVKQLKKYWALHGNDWMTVGSLIGRNNTAVQLKASQLRREVNKGLWSLEETNLLISAVKKFVLDSINKKAKGKAREPLFVTKEKLYKGIKWVQIEETVQTRNWTNCKTKWFDLLLIRMNNGINPFDGTLGVENKIKMIKWLHKSNREENWNVNWEELADVIGNVPPSVVQTKLYRLKSEHVPDWQTLSFSDIVEYLYSERLPQLEEKLELLYAKENYSSEVPKKTNKFSVSEIFQEYLGSEMKKYCKKRSKSIKSRPYV